MAVIRLALRSERWNVKKLDRGRIIEMLQEEAESLSLHARITSGKEVEASVEQTIALFIRTCDAYMPQKINSIPTRNGCEKRCF